MEQTTLSAAYFKGMKRGPKEPVRKNLPPMNQEIRIWKILDYKRNKQNKGTYQLIKEYSHGYLGISQDGKEEYFRKSDFEVGLLEFNV